MKNYFLTAILSMVITVIGSALGTGLVLDAAEHKKNYRTCIVERNEPTALRRRGFLDYECVDMAELSKG